MPPTPPARTQAVRAGRLRVPPALWAVIAAVERQEHAFGRAPGLLPYDLLRTDGLRAIVVAVSVGKLSAGVDPVPCTCCESLFIHPSLFVHLRDRRQPACASVACRRLLLLALVLLPLGSLIDGSMVLL